MCIIQNTASLSCRNITNMSRVSEILKTYRKQFGILCLYQCLQWPHILFYIITSHEISGDLCFCHHWMELAIEIWTVSPIRYQRRWRWAYVWWRQSKSIGHCAPPVEPQNNCSRVVPDVRPVGWQPLREVASWLDRVNHPNIWPAEGHFRLSLQQYRASVDTDLCPAWRTTSKNQKPVRTQGGNGGHGHGVYPMAHQLHKLKQDWLGVPLNGHFNFASLFMFALWKFGEATFPYALCSAWLFKLNEMCLHFTVAWLHFLCDLLSRT